MNDLIEMVLVQGGTFKFGDKVSATVSDFSIGRYPVTQAQWSAVMGNNPSWFKNCDDCPVESVSWLEVQDFLSKLNSLTGKNYRLPTETEWEYAARGGNQSKGYLYAGSNNMQEVGWYIENAEAKTHPVGRKKPNELGLYDMSGNVWEWCWDWYEDYPKNPEQDYAGPVKGDRRVLRGGSWFDWFDNTFNCHSAVRSWLLPEIKCYFLGFRLARNL